MVRSGFISWIKRAWGIRRIEAVEFYTRTGWTVILVLLGFLCLTFPAYRQDVELLYDKLTYVMAIGLFGMFLVIDTIDTPIRLTYPDEYERFIDFCYLGIQSLKKYTIGYHPVSMRLECRLVTFIILAISLTLIALAYNLEYEENLDLCVYLAVVSTLSAGLIGAIGWYRMVIVERGYLIIPEDWPE